MSMKQDPGISVILGSFPNFKIFILRKKERSLLRFVTYIFWYIQREIENCAMLLMVIVRSLLP